MITQYLILNECLSEIKNSDLQPVEKLKIEVQLYGLKRQLLIQEEADILRGDPTSEAEFQDLKAKIKLFCNPGHNRGNLNDLVAHMSQMRQPRLDR